MRYIIFFTLFMLPNLAPAASSQGFRAALGFFPTTRLIKKTAEINQAAYTTDLFLGYTTASNYTFGIVYSVQHEEYKQIGFSNPSDNQNIIRDRGSVGVLVGHEFESFYAHIVLYGLSEWKDNFNSVLTTYNKGLGAQFDIGIPIYFSSAWYFAPQISMQAFQYQSSELAGTTSVLSPPMTDVVISPYLVLGFTL